MIADVFVDMKTNAGRFGDGILSAFDHDPSPETRAAFFRLAHVLQLVEAALTHG